jgi:hypothetical protein
MQFQSITILATLCLSGFAFAAPAAVADAAAISEASPFFDHAKEFLHNMDSKWNNKKAGPYGP